MAARKAEAGPYTIDDLHGLFEGGKGFELEDGWLIEVAHGARHNYVAQRLSRFIDIAVGGRALHVCLCGGWEIATPSGVRKPDIIVLPRDVVRTAVVADTDVIPAAEALLVAEVVAPGTNSERTDRVRKVREYAAIGIPQYWIVEHHPQPLVHRLLLGAGGYHADPVAGPGTVFSADVVADEDFRVRFDPAALLEI
ncbi:Uma2 family endonuclease [Nocardia goodfellowii]|uniref:Uma2 family endonuclease n=1 Tax=Nocardia goodfellowii TaxID=882446 RepID=A0ABS4QE54_9NOCA|nr:Uma2 family endonuclease [Nocardia goodfellowii]MBP2189981.1 Uma2 family endonuclease [Nocardia goodfellowii]